MSTHPRFPFHKSLGEKRKIGVKNSAETYRFEKERWSLLPRGAMSKPWIPEESSSRMKLWKNIGLRKAAPEGERLYKVHAKGSRSSIYALSVRTLTKRLSEMRWLDARCEQSHKMRACVQESAWAPLARCYPLSTRTRHPLSLRETAKDTRKCAF